MKSPSSFPHLVHYTDFVISARQSYLPPAPFVSFVRRWKKTLSSYDPVKRVKNARGTRFELRAK